MELTMYYMDSHPDRHLRGMIVGEIDVEAEDVLPCLEDHVSVVSDKGDFEVEYCNGTNILPRENITATLNQTSASVGSTITLAGLPDPCMLYVNSETTETTGGNYDLLLANSGEYLIEIFESKYVRKEWLFTAI